MNLCFRNSCFGAERPSEQILEKPKMLKVPTIFIHKMSIAQKEANETLFWLEIFYADDLLSESEFKSIYQDAEELMKMLTASILTKKKNKLIKRAAAVLIAISIAILFI